MPFALLIVGIVLVISAVRNTQDDLFTLVKGDFQGDGTSRGFLVWMLAIAIIGVIGYIEELRPLSRAFLTLIIVVLFLKNGGVFQELEQQLNESAVSSVSNNDAGNLQQITPLQPLAALGSVK